MAVGMYKSMEDVLVIIHRGASGFPYSMIEVKEDFTVHREKEMSKKYYDKLFKEYCIGDLSRYKENKIALRWRIEREVVDGKGALNMM